MPYIVTTRSPDLDAIEPYAVATLDEALEYVSTTICDLMAGENFGQYQDEFRAIGETGGSVGPLPDGTVIEVRRVSWPEMYALAGHETADTNAETILTAYNAQAAR